MTKPPYQHTPESLTALRGSIAKWEAIVAGTGIDQAGTNCPLCQLYFDDDNNPNEEDDGEDDYLCRKCPVRYASGKSNCEGTPYMKFAAAGGRYRIIHTQEQRDAAQAELDFLRSLLPKDEPNE